MTEATRDLFMEWFQRFGTTLRDDEYEGIIEALTEHDRQVAERAWDNAVEEAYASGWLHDFAKSDALARNPYRPAGPWELVPVEEDNR